MNQRAQLEPRYHITKDHGKWFVYDTLTKQVLGALQRGLTKAAAKYEADCLNAQAAKAGDRQTVT